MCHGGSQRLPIFYHDPLAPLRLVGGAPTSQMVATHNPKDDHGTQYRSAVYTHTPAQRAEAVAWKAKAEAALGRSIVTALEDASKFWPAEEYHQRYLEKGGQDATKESEAPIKCYG